MKLQKRQLPALILILAMVQACAAVAPGQDPVLVRAQQSYLTGSDTVNLLFKIELENKVLIESKLPGTHAVVEKIRTQAKLAFPGLLSAIDTYKANKDKDALSKWLAVVDDLLRSAQEIIGGLSAQGILKISETERMHQLRFESMLIAGGVQ